MNDQLLKAAPYIRGLNVNGETGAFVRCVEGAVDVAAPTGNLLPPLVIPESSPECDSIISAYEEYTKANGTHPAVVVVGTSGFLAVGSTYDHAVKVGKRFRESGGTPAAMSCELKAEPADQPVLAVAGRESVAKGRICVVTGGAQGFGEGIVRELVAAGAFVWIADINADGATLLCDELNSAAGCTVAMPVEANVTLEESVSEMIGSIVHETGGLDLFISNAGVLRAGSVKELAADDFAFITDVNYTGYFLCTKHAAPVMAAQNKASGGYFTDIIQINSKSGLEGSNRNAAYAGSKFGGVGLTQSFALELIEDNIKVNSICPGNFFDGPLWSDPEKGLFVQYLNSGKVPGAKSVEDVKRFYEAKVPMGRGCSSTDVVRAIYYIIEQRYETGQAVPVTGGQVMLR